MQINEKLPLIFGVPDKSFFAGFIQNKVFVAELRPGLEGMRVVSDELLQKGMVPVVICDNMMAFCMRQGLVSEVHIFYSVIKERAGICRTGSLAAALCAKVHGVPVHLHMAKESKAGDQDLLKIGGMQVTNADIKTYVPLTEEVPLELVDHKE